MDKHALYPMHLSPFSFYLFPLSCHHLHHLLLSDSLVSTGQPRRPRLDTFVGFVVPRNAGSQRQWAECVDFLMGEVRLRGLRF